MSNPAIIKSTNTPFATVRAACDAMADNSTDTVLITESVIGGAGFGLVAKTSGTYCIEGVKQADGSYPLVISLGVNDSGPDRLTYGKAIFNFEGGASSFCNLTARGAEVSGANGGNGAGFRVNATCPSNTGSNFASIGNQDGLLTDGSDTQELFYSDYVLDKNGFGREGYTHNSYIGHCKQVTFLRGEHTNSPHGHDMKSRALKTIVQQTRCEGSAEGRELDLSNGGIWESSNSEYIKHADAAQNNLVHIAPESVPDGRPEKYTSTNDLFQIDIPNNGRGLQFIQNDGNVECVLTDPKFMLGGVEISDADAAHFFTGKSPVRIVLTGGPRGPLLPVGCAGDIKAGGTAPAPITTPDPVPAPAPVPAATPAPVPATDTWVHIGNEGDTITVNADTTVRYGANGSYVTRVVSGVFGANNGFFGSDPVPGVVKGVDRLVTAGPAPVVAAPVVAPAAPAPNPAPAPTALSPLGQAVIAGCKAVLEASGYTVTKK